MEYRRVDLREWVRDDEDANEVDCDMELEEQLIRMKERLIRMEEQKTWSELEDNLKRLSQ